VQSFQQEHLKALGRIHDSQEAITAIRSAKHAGFDNFNIDLMHGLPAQTLTQAMQDLQQAIDLGPTHISWYQLTIEPNTAFYSSPPILPNDDRLADIQDAGESLLSLNQYNKYEVSAFGQSNKSARHNLNYWQFGDYIGIGAGAHSKLTNIQTTTIIRKWKSRSPKDYLDPNKSFCSGEKQLITDELPLEFIMNALRLTDGFSNDLFSNRTGLEPQIIKPTIDNLCDRKLLSQNNNHIKTTDLGYRFLNEILAEF
jgi:oxygen-independent coproporphyrinogen-3 oxidase